MDPRLTKTLEKVRRRMTAWQAMVKLKWGLATIFAVLFVVGWVDFLLRLEQGGRVGAWMSGPLHRGDDLPVVVSGGSGCHAGGRLVRTAVRAWMTSFRIPQLPAHRR
jgi:hypothetical protein